MSSSITERNYMALWLYFLHLLFHDVTTYKGYAVHYAPNVMEKVARYRHLPITDCMLSTPYSEQLGSYVIVQSPYDTMACQIVDVSHPKDKARHIETKTTIELSWKAAKQLCNITRVGQRSKYHCPIILYIPNAKE